MPTERAGFIAEIRIAAVQTRLAAAAFPLQFLSTHSRIRAADAADCTVALPPAQVAELMNASIVTSRSFNAVPDKTIVCFRDAINIATLDKNTGDAAEWVRWFARGLAHTEHLWGLSSPCHCAHSA